VKGDVHADQSEVPLSLPVFPLPTIYCGEHGVYQLLLQTWTP
jgi:hypothetical protein